VVLAAGGYPQSPRSGDAIGGLGAGDQGDVQVFHAGTKRSDGQVVTSGGRVLTVCAHGSDLVDARKRAYEAAERISFPGMHFRRDIAGRGPVSPGS
jgi:phosphoribosylamine--glycine ligase